MAHKLTSGSPQLMMLLQNQMACAHNRRNSLAEDGFYSERRVPYALFLFNVSIFNFPQEPFSLGLIFVPLLPVLLSFLQSSGTSPSPFELHPLAFMVSVACSVSYYLTLPAKFMFPGFASQLEVLMSAFGSLAVAILVSLILHLPWWSISIILLFIWGFFKLLNKLHATYAYMRRPQPRIMQALLPLYNDIFSP